MWINILFILGALFAFAFIFFIIYLGFSAIFGMFELLMFFITLGQYEPGISNKKETKKEVFNKVKHPVLF